MGYRAPDFGPTTVEQQLIQDLRDGRTEKQRKRAFMDKLLMGGLQAGLAGVSGGAKALVASNLEKERAISRSAHETSEFTKGRGYEEPGAPVVPSRVPEWLRAEQEGPDDGSLYDPQGAAEQAKRNMSMNQSAELATIGGHSTSKGAANQAEQSDMLGRDQAMGKSLMQESQTQAAPRTWGVPQDHGRGMMGSIGPEEDYDYYAGRDKG